MMIIDGMFSYVYSSFMSLKFSGSLSRKISHTPTYLIYLIVRPDSLLMWKVKSFIIYTSEKSLLKTTNQDVSLWMFEPTYAYCMVGSYA